jgi:phospholipid/cholesterol/gamma-HCH transport system substrate-binding protein
MNERVMQFRIGMFVLAAGMALLMMIIWFGESPTILRDQVFIKVHYLEAPGVGDGIPVRRSGIKVGEVTSVEFDDRPGQPEGVIVTLALDRKAKLKVGTVPRITRALIGDVAIEMIPGGSSSDAQPVGNTAATAPLIEGDVTPDPTKALAAATAAFERVGGTLTSIEDAAKGIATVTKKAEGIDGFLTTWTETGKSLGTAGGRIDALIKANEADFNPAVANLRAVSEKLNKTLDEKTTAELKTAIDRISSAGAKIDAGLTSLNPLLADLGADVRVTPTTNFGQTMWRANRVASDLNLLTRTLSDGKGGLNTNGTIQRLLVSSALYDNWNSVSVTANELLHSFRPVVASIKTFADRVSRDPSAITRGALQR